MNQSSTVAQLASKTARNAVQRVEELEATVEVLKTNLQTLQEGQSNIINSSNEEFTKLNTKVGSLAELVRALIDAVGPAEVERVVKATRQADDVTSVENMKAEIVKGIAKGELKTAEAISDKSLLVFVEKDPSGVVLEYGSRKQWLFSQVGDAFKPQLLGKDVGAILTAPNGATFEVVEFYDTVANAVETPVVPEVAAPVVS
jgi:hypothetical protein